MRADFSGKVETLRWYDNAVEMIDQRALPTAKEYVRCDSAASVAEAIKNMVIRGAPAIGVAAAFGIALEALRLKKALSGDFYARLDDAFGLLAQSRPTAVNLFWALNRMQKHLQSLSRLDPVQTAHELLAEATRIHEEDIRANKHLGICGAALLPDGARVMTHCNAGALATAGHGTALGVFRSAIAAGKRLTIIVNETRPLLQGARLTAWELVQENIPATLITDNMAGYMMQTGEVDAVVVGADRVAANGDVANKIGTYMIAVLAKRHNIPFYVACPLSTIDLALETGRHIPIEERDTREVSGFRDCLWAAEGVHIRNPAFDVTPAELVSALITEKGVIHNELLLAGGLKSFVENPGIR